MTLSNIKSILEKQIDSGEIIEIGDMVIYSDHSNFEKYYVEAVFEGGFTIRNHHEEKDLFYGEMQYGWELKKVSNV